MPARAERFYAHTRTVAVDDVPIARPGCVELLLRVAFCGVCHTVRIMVAP